LGLSMAGWVFLFSFALAVLIVVAHWPVRLKGLD